ncbi:MAG: 3-isopropylmalate dehydratase [Burkholderiales bacterium]|nr:3-isopropylmalate dehydratase [Burkholderiales bacterium]
MSAPSSSDLIRGPAHLLGDDVNTDLHCSTKYLPGKDNAFVAARAFEDLAPGFAQRFEPGGIIVAGANFGINSSREQATHVLKLLGCAALVARSFGRQFFRNCINNGLPVVECTLTGLDEGDAIEIDLARGCVRAGGVEHAVPPLPAEVRAILAAGGLHAFLHAHPDWRL